VFNDYGGVRWMGVEYFSLEGVADSVGTNIFRGQSNSATGVFGSDGPLAVRVFIDTDDEFGDVVQPGELRVVDDQLKKLAGVDVPVLGARTHGAPCPEESYAGGEV